MKTRAPVDLQRICVQPGAPSAQAVDRDVVCCSVIFGAHATPVQRFDMHRPERLDRLVALAPGHRLSRSLAPLACHLTRRFQQIQRIEPAVERALVQPMEATILGASHNASTPRLQMSRPPCPSCFVFEVSCPHRRSSHARRNPISFASAPPNRCARPGRLPPNDPSPGPDSASDERERGWSSALFPPKSKPPEGETKDAPNDQPIAQEAPSAGVTNAHPFAAKAPVDSLFVLRSSDRGP